MAAEKYLKENAQVLADVGVLMRKTVFSTGRLCRRKSFTFSTRCRVRFSLTGPWAVAGMPA